MSKICIAILDLDEGGHTKVLAATSTPKLVDAISKYYYQVYPPELALSLKTELQEWQRSGIPEDITSEDLVSATFRRLVRDILIKINIHTGVDL